MEKTTVKAQSKYLRQSPYKMRLVLNLIRGLDVQDALNLFNKATELNPKSSEFLGWEDFTDYKILSVDHADVWEGEAVKKIKVVRSDDQFLHQEEEN